MYGWMRGVKQKKIYTTEQKIESIAMHKKEEKKS
jgi:hypothetical protein